MLPQNRIAVPDNFFRVPCSGVVAALHSGGVEYLQTGAGG